MYSGVLGPAYDFHTILKAAKILESKRDIVFVIRGDGECEQMIVDTVKEFGLHNVVLLGKVERVEEVAQYLNLADVFVLPMKKVNVSETAIPSKVYEFLACGKPVICCAEGALAELVGLGDCGIAAKPGDPNVLAKAILSLFHNLDERIKMGIKGRKFVTSNFSYESVGKQLGIIFQNLDAKPELSSRQP